MIFKCWHKDDFIHLFMLQGFSVFRKIGLSWSLFVPELIYLLGSSNEYSAKETKKMVAKILTSTQVALPKWAMIQLLKQYRTQKKLFNLDSSEGSRQGAYLHPTAMISAFFSFLFLLELLLWIQKSMKYLILCQVNQFLRKVHVRCIKIVTWLRGFRDKIANFSRLHCLAVSRSDLSTIKTKPNSEILPESLEVILEM